MAGPFTGYAPPGVYTETRLDPAVSGLLGNLRVPAFIGTGRETLILDGFDMVRGSSASQDNLKSNEDVSSQLSGTNNSFAVANYPIVKGDGTGASTNNPNDVSVKVNGEVAIVSKVDGLNGEVTLALTPKSADVVTITYFYNKTDTKITDEDNSAQADGSTTTFFTHFKPIVDGTNGGRVTTNVSDIIVKVNGALVVVTRLDGVNGSYTLETAPASGDTVEATYYFNMHANTEDDLPQSGLIRVIRVGLSPETSDFIENVDFAIIGDTIQWGTGYKLVVAEHTTGCGFFEDQIVGQTVDDRIYNEDVSSQFTGVETEITVKFAPIVDGSGRDIVSADPTTVVVTVNGTEVSVRRVQGATGKIELVVAPSGGDTVLVTYYRSRMEDDTYAMEIITAGATGVGTYTVTSEEDGRLGVAVPGAENVANASFTGASYLTGPMVSKGFTIDETVTLTFTSNTEFAVSSSSPNGSSGAGTTDSTYVDSTTGLIFTLEADPFYASGDTIEIDVTAEAIFTTSVIPIYSIPGMRVNVNNTTDTCVGDITNLITFDKSGNEPRVGDTYYISYEYEKTDFGCKLFTKFVDVTNEYGDLNVNNPLTLAAYLSFTNGAVALIMCQVVKTPGAETAPDLAYIQTLDDLKQSVDGVNPAIICPLSTSETVIEALSAHVTQQSSKRYRRERIGFFGFATGTEPSEAGSFAQAIGNTRMTAVYPDGAVIELVNADGSVSSNVVDGSYLAAAYSGLNVSPAFDVATPMTRKAIVGFKELVRTMDEVTMDMVATRGVTIIEKVNPFRVRHALTTDMSSSLTREQNIIKIRDFIQQEGRRVLDPYIGRKFVRTIPGDIATTLAAMLRAAIEAEIIVDFQGVTAERDEVEPDFVRATAYYIPVFGVNYIEIQFNIRVRF